MQNAIILAAILGLGLAQPAPQRTQVFFEQPNGMKVFWHTRKDGKTDFSTAPLETPGRYNFAQGATYRLKLTHLPRHAGLDLFPTLEVTPVNAQTRAFLDHNSVPIRLTDDEINQVVKGNLVVKVVYLPRDQPAADAELGVLSGQDAVREAMRRGNILLVLRIGNISEPSVSDKK